MEGTRQQQHDHDSSGNVDAETVQRNNAEEGRQIFNMETLEVRAPKVSPRSGRQPAPSTAMPAKLWGQAEVRLPQRGQRERDVYGRSQVSLIERSSN